MIDKHDFRRPTCAVLAVSMLASACVGRMAPPPAPPRTPIADTEPDRIEPDAARLLVETTEGPALVSVVTSESVVVTSVGAVVGKTGTKLCITPCAVDLKPGMITLEFSRHDDPTLYASTDIQLRRGRNSLRQALGRHKPADRRQSGGMTLAALGLSAVATGLIFWGLSDEIMASRDTAIGLTIGGAAASIGGVLLAWSGRAVSQPGAATQWWEPYPDGPQKPPGNIMSAGYRPHR